MTVDLTAAEYHDEAKAREWLEISRWPNGPCCPHCGSFDALRMEGKGHREGLLHCRDCRGQYTVLTGSVMERSHLPLTKWVLAIRLMTASKKGMSAHQMHRMLNIGYKSAWFMCHRIREAMRAFRWNNRSRLGVEDQQRAQIAAYGMNHKGLTYRRTDEAQDASPTSEGVP